MLARLLVFLACSAVPLLAQVTGDFRWEEPGGGKLRLMQGAHHVLDYNYGPQLKPGVPEDRRRAGYVYPLYTPAGVNPLDDFPRDHYHHRGVFWAWLHVGYEGKIYDMWTLRPGVTLRFHKFVGRHADNNRAYLGVENGWYVGETLIMRETVDITVQRAVGGKRDLQFALTFQAAEKPVDLAGSPDQGKGYGGFCVRFAPREETRIYTPEGPVGKDENEVPHAWAALEARFQGKQAGLRVESDTANPGHPPGWCLRPYGFVGANFPGLEKTTIQPGKPLALNYKVTVYDGHWQ